MNHQEELEKKKYRNWVRGGLAYKYLKDGIKGFAGDLVQEEHMRIIHNVISGRSCDKCCLRNLRPLHTCKKDHAGRNKCPWGQNSCNCLYTKKQRCLNNVCDAIMEDILKNHGSTPPSPNWKSTDILKWCSAPWEIAKCFINATGYSDKSKIDDIDISGLLHIFINNISHKSHLSDKINKGDLFLKILQRRNELFHSPNMEMEDSKLCHCIYEIIAILEDEKELKARRDAQEAVLKLKQLKQEQFIITTHNEVEVCRDALASITNKAEELKQTIEDAKNDIAKKQEEATEVIGDETKKVLRDVLGESDNQTETLYERVDRLESDNLVTKQRLVELEEKVDKIDIIRHNHQKQLDYVEGKQVLQEKMMQFYQNHYVWTSVSPLKLQENDMNIKEVFVNPEMVAIEKNDINVSHPEEKSQNKPNIRHLTGYQEILQTHGQKHKQIYIIGDVGTGKSTVCKMMIQNWCSAKTDESPTSSNNSKLKFPDKSANCEDINEMRNFDFLFFVPLQGMSGQSDIIEMIKAIATKADLASTDLIDRIFQQESEHCLIVLDGLDEWTPPSTKPILQHVSYGLPEKDSAKHATVVTFSRPSAKGILNMKVSECDQKVELLGIKDRSVKSFIVKYLSKFNRTCLSYKAFMGKIKVSKLEHLEKTPLLLQQLIWLYGLGHEIGKSVTDTYSHLVNIMLGWSQNKEETKSLKQGDICSVNQDKQLPERLRRFPKCEVNKSLLLSLARIAFDALTSETKSSIFARSNIQARSVSEDAITSLIKLGILNEVICFDPTYETSMLQFIHISYLEFFAAIHVSSQLNDNQCSKRHITILEEHIFRNCKSAADILQFSNILKMICGLSLNISLISELSKMISDIVSRDEDIITHRRFLSLYWWKNACQELEQIQTLILNCMLEGDSDDQLMFSLCDVVIDRNTRRSLQQRIIPENVLYLYIRFTRDVEVWRWIVQLKQLQYMSIHNSRLSHSEMVLVSSFIQEAPLRCLSLINVSCFKSDCKCHMIDLSKHDKLQKLQLLDCNKVIIANINTEQLQILHFCSFDTLDTNLLVNASSLTEFHFGGYFSPRFKYNKQVDSVIHTLHQLRKLRLHSVNIDTNAYTVTPEMRNLEHIELDEITMSLETWRTFVGSLLTLQQSVSVSVSLHVFYLFGNDTNKLHYVMQNKSFEVVEYSRSYFRFKTKK